MTAHAKIALTSARDIPLNKLTLSQRNVRRIKGRISIEDLAEDISNRGLLQSLSVRPVLDATGQETGTFEVPAGGRRFQALQLLAKQKRLAKNAPVPCIVKADGIAEEDSLAENTMREALHPLDQFRAFKALREDHGLDDEEIAARFFVTPQVVKQRLRLLTVSPKLLDVYAADGMTLEQLMAFSVSPDHARQEQIWDIPDTGWNKEPHQIRRLLTQDHVEAGRDRRALFVGVEAYEAAGGVVLRDLFSQDNGGWMKDVPLLTRLAQDKLQAIAAEVVSEGWKWVETAESFPYNHTYSLRRVAPTEIAMTEDEAERHDALRREQDALQLEHEGADELPEEVDARLGEIERELEAFDAASRRYGAEVMAYAGAFVSIGYDGTPAIERGWVRPGDEPKVPAERSAEEAGAAPSASGEAEGGAVQRVAFAVGDGSQPVASAAEPEDEDPERPLSARLLTELTTHRTVALREALAADPGAAFVAVLHALALGAFYGPGYVPGYSYRPRSAESCLEIQFRSTAPGSTVPGVGEAPGAVALERRRQDWRDRLPEDANGLWDALVALDADSRADLFALCAGMSLNAVQSPHPYESRDKAVAHAGQVAELLGLDMAAQWAPTAENFLGQVTKGRILAAVREAKGESAAQLIDHLKKADMAREAERLLDGTGWLPQPLRTPGLDRASLLFPSAADASADEPGESGETLPAFLTEPDADEGSRGEPAPSDGDRWEHVHPIAAE